MSETPRGGTEGLTPEQEHTVRTAGVAWCSESMFARIWNTIDYLRVQLAEANVWAERGKLKWVNALNEDHAQQENEHLTKRLAEEEAVLEGYRVQFCLYEDQLEKADEMAEHLEGTCWQTADCVQLRAYRDLREGKG